MPVQLCPRCQRTNPNEALFCFHDGAELRGGSAIYRGGELGREFIFPSGRRCKTFDDFAGACSENWNAARDLLRQGGIRQFFAGIGRMDLAMQAEKSASLPDADVALDEFLAKLPTRDAPAPRLDIMPRRLNLGKIKIGDNRQYQLRVINQGARMLHGTVNAEGEDWLSLGAGDVTTVPIKTGKQQLLTIHIDTVGLVAGQKYASKLTVITNGGVVEVPITLEVAPIPFPFAPLQGASSPRDLAARMRDNPKAVPPLLESGEIQRWFQSNGWSYPVQGASAKGVAAVQQFFEGLGLSKPPHLQISDQEVLMICRAGRSAEGHITLKTPAKKWVYARVESDVPWLKVLGSDVGGAQEARIDFEASARDLEGNRRHQGNLKILANGGQRFNVQVWNEVRIPTVSPLSRIVTGLAVGAACGLLYRLAFCAFAAVALLIGVIFRGWNPNELETLIAAATGGWLRRTDESFTLYLRYFSVAAGLGGMAIGAVWLSIKGGRDIVPGLLVGAVTFLAIGVTGAIVLDVLDQALGWIIPLPWPGMALAGWAIWGALIGLLLNLTGKAGQKVLSIAGRPLYRMAARLGFGEFAP